MSFFLPHPTPGARGRQISRCKLLAGSEMKILPKELFHKEFSFLRNRFLSRLLDRHEYHDGTRFCYLIPYLMPSFSLMPALDALPAHCLVGVSGGVDSIALVHALVAAGKQQIIIHFDHGWRQDSTQDSVFVQNLATKLKLKCLVGKASKMLKKSEQSARAARWAFFEKAAKRMHCRDLVLAHNADDQVETLLLQLLRGGGSGARGMRSESVRSNLKVYRPWLGIWRREILTFARKNKLSWHEDSTNTDTKWKRNRVRHRLVPYLKTHFSKDAAEALWRAAEILGAESDWLETTMTTSGPRSDLERLPVKRLRGLPVAQTRRLLRNWLQARGVNDVGFDDIEAVRALVENRFPAKVNLAGGRHARRQAGSLFVE